MRTCPGMLRIAVAMATASIAAPSGRADEPAQPGVDAPPVPAQGAAQEPTAAPPELRSAFTVSSGPALANVLDRRAPGLALRVAFENESTSRPLVFARDVMLLGGRTERHPVWLAAFGATWRRIEGRLRYGGGLALGFATGRNRADASDWMLPMYVHGDASIDFYRGERLDGFIDASAGAGLEAFYTASLVVGLRLARR